MWRADGSVTDDDAIALVLDGGILSYRSRRRLGGVTYLRPGQALTDVAGELGPDATEVGRAELAELLAGRRGGIKSALLDQASIAGLGSEPPPTSADRRNAAVTRRGARSPG